MSEDARHVRRWLAGRPWLSRDGRVLTVGADGRNPRTLSGGLSSVPDGVADPAHEYLSWTLRSKAR